MKFIYVPDFGFKIEDHTANRTIKWNDQRKYIRKTVLIEYSYKEDDYDYHDLNLSQRRDIYILDDVCFFLNYDVLTNCLKEVEVHHGVDIEVNGVILKFGENITKIIEQLGIQPQVLDDGGTYLFPSLKMTMSNSQAMGDDDNSSNTSCESQSDCEKTDEQFDTNTENFTNGLLSDRSNTRSDDNDGNHLAYFYAASNIDHLLEEVD